MARVRAAARPDGKLPLIASAQGGSNIFQLAPGSYLVHASFGRAGATKRITVGREGKQENIVLDAGGLKLNAMLAGGKRIRPRKLKFSIYEAKPNAKGERALIIPNVNPNTVVRLNSGTYQVVSTYGTDNAVIRSDIRVEAGKLTEATVEHHAAELTMKLVREPGGEAIADTSWSVLTGVRRPRARQSSAPSPRWCWPKATTRSSPRTATSYTSATQGRGRPQPGSRGHRQRSGRGRAGRRSRLSGTLLSA